MSDGMELVEKITKCAKLCHERGVTSVSLRAHAKMQEEWGMSVSAPYTSLLAQAVEQLEKETKQ